MNGSERHIHPYGARSRGSRGTGSLYTPAGEAVRDPPAFPLGGSLLPDARSSGLRMGPLRSHAGGSERHIHPHGSWGDLCSLETTPYIPPLVRRFVMTPWGGGTRALSHSHGSSVGVHRVTGAFTTPSAVLYAWPQSGYAR